MLMLTSILVLIGFGNGPGLKFEADIEVDIDKELETKVARGGESMGKDDVGAAECIRLRGGRPTPRGGNWNPLNPSLPGTTGRFRPSC